MQGCIAPVLMATRWIRSDLHRGLTGKLPISFLLSFGRGDVSDELQQSAMATPGLPFQRRKFLWLHSIPGCSGSFRKLILDAWRDNADSAAKQCVVTHQLPIWVDS